jgi:A1 cistron-splicing factor AAR2
MEVEPNSVINFTPIPKSFYGPGTQTSCSDITRHNIDSSLLLESLLKDSDPNSILGELQFSFITFLVGQVYDGFEHWKRLLRVLCKSDAALLKYPEMFINFIRVLYFQLQEVPNDLFVDIVDKDNFLVMSLREFFSNIDEQTMVDDSLRRRGERFKKYVTKKFRWDFDAEPEDEAPVVVQL